MSPSDNPIQDAIDHLRSLESDCGDKDASLDNFINEVTEIKDQLDEHATSLSELITQLNDVAAIAQEVDESMSEADRFLD